MWTDLDRRYLKARLDNIERMLGVMYSELMEEERATMGTVQDLADKVAANTTVTESVVTLLDGLAQQIKDAGGDPAKLDEVIANIEANTEKLAAAVTRDTAAHDEPHAGGM